jgi:glutamine synthetase
VIKTLTDKIFAEFSLNIKLAGEIEFYILPQFESEAEENDFLAKLLFNLTAAKIAVWQIGKEVTQGQYEVALQPKEPEIAVEEINKVKEIIGNTIDNQLSTINCKRTALFAAKPFSNLPGSGLHIHIGVTDVQGNSVLQRAGEQGDREGETEIMLNIIGGLCKTMLLNFTAFAPFPESYARFSSQANPVTEDENPLNAYNNAPVNVSWGGNNRTTAIRIPASSYDETTRHIEHRVAGADADPEAVINAILEGVYVGLKEKLTPPEKIYGNAFLPQYDYLQPFPKSS